MDVFLQRLGEGYLERKANAIPGQLENMAMKQFKNQTNTEKQAKQASKLPSDEKDQEIARLRKELALTKMDKGKATAEAKHISAGKPKGKVAADAGALEALDPRRSNKSKPQVHNAKNEAAEMEGLGRRSSTRERSSAAKVDRGAIELDTMARRRSMDENDDRRDSRTALIPASHGRRRRSPTYTAGGRSSMDSIESRHDSRYNSPRQSRDFDRRELYLVEVTEPISRRRTNEEGSERRRDRREKRYYDEGTGSREIEGERRENGRSDIREEEENAIEIKKDRGGRMYMVR